MVGLSTIHASNALIKATFPPGLVAVFVGATSGIGKVTLTHFVQHVRQPRIYFIGRSQQAADEILYQLNQTNPDGNYHFMRSDVSLLNEVDAVCEQIMAKEKHIDLLFQSQGTLDVMTKTDESLTLILALHYYSRMRFIANLLPLLEKSPSSGRVISVMAGTKEGPIDPTDIPGKRIVPWKARGHLCSMITLTLEKFAEAAPRISFIHDYPGYVDTPLSHTMKGFVGGTMRAVFSVTSLFTTKEIIPLEESGERHVFLLTSCIYPPRDENLDAAQRGVQKIDGIQTAIGSDGEAGSGVYSIGATGESADENVQRLLNGLRQNGTKERVWQHLQQEFQRITGKHNIPRN